MNPNIDYRPPAPDVPRPEPVYRADGECSSCGAVGTVFLDPRSLTGESYSCLCAECWRTASYSHTSPLAVSYDRDAAGFPLTTAAGCEEAPGFPTVATVASGGTRETALSDHLVSLGAHTVKPRRSRKGRQTFDVTHYGALGAPTVDDESGLAGGSAIDLVALADGILRQHEGERVVSPTGHVTYDRSDYSGAMGAYLIGSSVMAWSQLVRDDRSAVDVGNVADHHADLYSALGQETGRMLAERPALMRRDRNVTGHVARRHRPLVMSASWADSLTEHRGSRQTSIADAHPTRGRIRGTLRKAERGTYRRFLAGTVDGERSKGSATTYVTESGDLVSWHADPSKVWHGFSLVDRPTTAGGKRSSTTTVKRGRPTSSATGPTVPAPDADGVIQVSTARGTLTIRPAGKSGRHSVSLVTPTGDVERWQSRTPAAAIVRAR